MPQANSFSPVRTLLILILYGLVAVFQAGIASATGNPDLIFVQIPVTAQPADQNKSYITSARDSYVAHARIVHLAPDEKEPVNLTAGFFSACDPDVSFDGKYILFAGKKMSDDFWQIWQMRSDGTELKRITSVPVNCLMPVYAGNRFYLDDPQPTPQIIYAAEVPGWFNPVESGPVLAIYGTDHEGKAIHRLTFNLFSDFSPDVLADGRIVFSSRQPTGNGRLALMAINNDGTDLMPYYGNHESPVYKEMVHISDTDKRVYYIESDTLRWLGGGSIAEISQSRPLHSWRRLTGPDQGIFHSPCPLPGAGLIASFRQNESEPFGLYQIDAAKGSLLNTVFVDPAWHSVDAQPLTAHPVVQGRSNWLIPGTTTGVFYCLDSYRSDLPEGDSVENGDICYVRVSQGLPDKAVAHNDSEVKRQNTSIPVSRRVLGTVPVEKDGSFQVRVPAHTPINFQLLDKDYVKIREQRGWTWVIGNENRGCIGCHENREFSPPNKMVDAVKQPAHDLTGSTETGGIIDFRNDIAPLIGKSCAGNDCHASGEHEPFILVPVKNKDHAGVMKTYENLLTAHSGRSYVYPGSAKNSRLTEVLLQKNAVQSGEQEHAAINLTDADKRLIIEWIDLGAAWDLSSLRETDAVDNKNSGKQ